MWKKEAEFITRDNKQTSKQALYIPDTIFLEHNKI